ncbi:hypothetical protein [Zunongwangia pacifica]|uniref:Lipoprotein n=1 Tax=Zunongwangia pacifica TaxID=2911062 RepID=A0A9X1ZYM3_9FLAO|nr:hypothetical protein [Zunongwangia pacifica]MCL6221008.1 hypothetical protein [Zunongwangia pacifica]
MNFKTIFPLLTLIGILVSCKSNFVGKELNYSTEQRNGFELTFVNDSILEVNSKTEINKSDKATYKYELLKKETLVTVKKNQPVVNFKTKKQSRQFLQNIAIELISGKNEYLRESDTLIYLKIRTDGKIKKQIFFDNRTKILEFQK